jgi:hypothetical protein
MRVDKHREHALGLVCFDEADTDEYPTGITYTAKDVETLPITRHSSPASGTTPSSRHVRIGLGFPASSVPVGR